MTHTRARAHTQYLKNIYREKVGKKFRTSEISRKEWNIEKNTKVIGFKVGHLMVNLTLNYGRLELLTHYLLRTYSCENFEIKILIRK